MHALPANCGSPTTVRTPRDTPTPSTLESRKISGETVGKPSGVCTRTSVAVGEEDTSVAPTCKCRIALMTAVCAPKSSGKVYAASYDVPTRFTLNVVDSVDAPVSATVAVTRAVEPSAAAGTAR